MKRKGAVSGSELRKKIEKRNLWAIQNENDRKINSKPMENPKHITSTIQVAPSTIYLKIQEIRFESLKIWHRDNLESRHQHYWNLILPLNE